MKYHQLTIGNKFEHFQKLQHLKQLEHKKKCEVIKKTLQVASNIFADIIKVSAQDSSLTAIKRKEHGPSKNFLRQIIKQYLFYDDLIGRFFFLRALVYKLYIILYKLEGNSQHTQLILVSGNTGADAVRRLERGASVR